MFLTVCGERPDVAASVNFQNNVGHTTIQEGGPKVQRIAPQMHSFIHFKPHKCIKVEYEVGSCG